MNARTKTPPTVGEVMHRPVVAVSEGDSLWTAMDLMLSHGLRHLVVVHGETARGVIVDRELAAVWAMDPLGLKNRRAADVLGAAQTFLGPETDVVSAAERMRSLGTDAVVVVDSANRPVGILTDHDLLGVLIGLLTGSDERVGDRPPRPGDAARPTRIPG